MNTKKMVVVNGTMRPASDRGAERLITKYDEKLAELHSEITSHYEIAKKAPEYIAREEDHKIEKLRDEYERLASEKAVLTTADTFIDTGVVDLGYIPSSHNYVISEGLRFKVNESNLRLVYPGYEFNYAADSVAEGALGETKNLTDLLHSETTDEKNIIRLSAVLNVFESAYKDDTETMDQAIDDLLDSATENAENREALDKLIKAKTAVEINVGSLIPTINNNLCATAKRNAEIWTNDSGFAALDVTVNGVRMIERDPASGEFIYDRKYIVRQFSDTILPNTEAGAPRVLIGDFKNILRFGIISTQDKRIDSVFPANIYFNRYVKEVIALTTTQNSAWISCYINK